MNTTKAKLEESLREARSALASSIVFAARQTLEARQRAAHYEWAKDEVRALRNVIAFHRGMLRRFSPEDRQAVIVQCQAETRWWRGFVARVPALKQPALVEEHGAAEISPLAAHLVRQALAAA